jgi:hypothetical protein
MGDRLPEPEELRQARRRRARRAAWFVAVPILSAFAGAAIERAYGPLIASFVRGEIGLDGDPRYEPRRRLSPEAARRLDMEAVHARLIPAWAIAHNHRLDSPEAFEVSGRTHTALLDALRPDPDAHELMVELTDAFRGGPLRNLRRLDYLGWAWNALQEQRGLPYRLELGLQLGLSPTVFSASYRVLDDAQVGVGEQSYRARVLLRLDHTSVRETYLGHTEHAATGGLIVGDQVVDFAVRHVWPALAPVDREDRSSIRRAFAGMLQRAATDELRVEDVSLLLETAPAVRRLVDATAEINGRRACGSEFRIREITWRGIATSDEEALFDAVVAGASPDCPEVSLGEASTLVRESSYLARTVGLRRAVGHLAAWIARAIAVHEVRHAADEDLLERTGRDRPCPGCPPWLAQSGRAELSAYVTSFGNDDGWILALYQACLLPADAGGPHEAALFVARRHLLPRGCEAPIPEDLPFHARSLERRLHGDAEPVRVPAVFGTELATLL